MADPSCLPNSTPHPVVAVVLAGGSGSRFGADIPKQLVDLAGQPILYHALRAFDDAGLADLVVIPANPAWYPEIAKIASQALRHVQYTVVDGGVARNASVANSLAVIPFEEAKVLVHDGVRPLVSAELILRVSNGLDSAACVIPTIPSIDPVVRVDDRDGRVTKFLARSSTLRGQSPQGFWLGNLRRIFETEAIVADSRDTIFELILDYDPATNIRHVQGDLNNVKVTMPVDRAIATAILNQVSRGLVSESNPTNPYH